MKKYAAFALAILFALTLFAPSVFAGDLLPAEGEGKINIWLWAGIGVGALIILVAVSVFATRKKK